jgi:hypothetical protein
LLQSSNFERAEAVFFFFFLLKHYHSDYCAVLETMPHVKGKFDDGGQKKRAPLHSHEMNFLHVYVRSHAQDCVCFPSHSSFKNAKESAADQAAPSWRELCHCEVRQGNNTDK